MGVGLHPDLLARGVSGALFPLLPQTVGSLGGPSPGLALVPSSGVMGAVLYTGRLGFRWGPCPNLSWSRQTRVIGCTLCQVVFVIA